MTATVKKDYKEIAKKNIFVKNAAEIREICLKEDVDIGVGADMWIANNKVAKTKEVMEQYQEYRELCKEVTLKVIEEEIAK